MKQTTLALTLILLFLTSLSQPLALNEADTMPLAQSTQGRSTACSISVCLNEAMPNPNGADNGTWPGGEWFELYNSGINNVNLTGWSVENNAGKTLTFDSNTIVDYQANNASTWTIAPGEYVVIARNGDSNFYMTNTGATLTLHDASATNVHEATWGGVTSGKSYQEDPASPTNNWVQTGAPSPGQVNSAGTAPTLIPSDLMINEVMANPWPSYDNATWPGGEWVELTNTGNSDMDLTGWILEDAAGNQLAFDTNHLVNATSDPASMMISPGEHRIVAVNGSSQYGVLNNGAESLTLKWPNGSPSHIIEWTSTVQGFSLNASDSTNTLWIQSAYPTPDEANAPVMTAMPVMDHDVRMTELYTNASSEPDSYPDGEWIELHNNGAVAVDLLGWSIIDGLGNITYLDPASIVFNSSQGSTNIDPDERRLIQFTADTRLWDNYNHLMLTNASGSVVDSASYVTDYGEGVSLIRSSNAYDPWSPAAWMTPGQPEPGSEVSEGLIRFSEILPDAVGSDSQSWPNGEWIELQNIGENDIDVAGWKLQAAGRSLTLHQYNMPLQNTSVIPAGGVGVVALNGTSSFYLKHTSADSMGLLDLYGITVETISWSSTVEGESLIAPNSTHAGAGPTGVNITGDWTLSAWATPGEVNPTWSAYNGSTDVAITEILPYCNDDSIEPFEDWVEVHNIGSEVVNLSRWSLMSGDGSKRFIRTDAIWNPNTTLPNTTHLEVGERAVILMDEWVLTGLGDAIALSDPDNNEIAYASWTVITDCQTLQPGAQSTDGWIHTLWPTPGEVEPDPANLASPDDLRFTRFMPTNQGGDDMEFIEITNQGTKLAMLEGWILRSVSSAGTVYDATFNDVFINPESSLILTADDSLSSYEDGDLMELSSALDQSFYIASSGAAIQLLTPSSTEVDTLVYGNGPVDVTGWNGIALAEPVTNLANLIYLRGDGCGESPDTDTVQDWHTRWSRLGGSSFCFNTTLSSTGTITPIIGPEDGLVDLLNWINGASSSLEVHMYQLQHVELVDALIQAHQRGVEVTVVLDYGDNWWNEFDLDNNRGMATTLLAEGIDVYWFGDMGENPYAYIHSKVAVRDNSSVWMGSGNWKTSSHPYPGNSANREWGVIVEDSALATMVQAHLRFDESSLRSHITPVEMSDAPTGWSFPTPSSVVGNITEGLTVDYTATLLVCPDNCINELVKMLDEADEEILLSLQYLDMDWSYGWGDNPLLSALEEAAQRGVRIRLILNGAYLDEDIQSVVDQMNEEWNASLGYDTNAVVMSPSQSVNKLHNKGVIIDESSVLVSSINWGDSALVRNREMGLFITSEVATAPYLASWHDDWNRVDVLVDTDQDGLNDAWEQENGLNRTRRIVLGTSLDEGAYDADNDGLTNEAELLHGGDPTNPDTDQDCILDGLEVAWALVSLLNTSMTDVSPIDALRLADADGDGVNESDALGCELLGIEVNGNETEPPMNETADDDEDGVLNGVDQCPGTTPIGTATDPNGCSSKQRAANIPDGAENTAGDSAETFFLMLMIGALLLSFGAYGILRSVRKGGDEKEGLEAEAFDLANIMDEPQTPEWEQPVLDGTNTPEPSFTVTSEMLERVPGWDMEMVETYLKQGWTMDQLAEYYDQQVVQHAD